MITYALVPLTFCSEILADRALKTPRQIAPQGLRGHRMVGLHTFKGIFPLEFCV